MGISESILIAEPVEGISSELDRFLSETGLGSVRAKSLKETILCLQGQRFDALILDSSLLEQDCGFISIIKGIEEDLPIIICADVNTPQLESDIRQQGIFYYHIKPFGIQELEMAISNAIKRQSC